MSQIWGRRYSEFCGYRFRIQVYVVFKCYIGVIPIVIGAWLRYAGASPSLAGNSGYGLIVFSQVSDLFLLHCLLYRIELKILLGFSQPIFQIVAVRYSEAWFDLRGRTTATLIMSLGMR